MGVGSTGVCVSSEVSVYRPNPEPLVRRRVRPGASQENHSTGATGLGTALQPSRVRTVCVARGHSRGRSTVVEVGTVRQGRGRARDPALVCG